MAAFTATMLGMAMIGCSASLKPESLVVFNQTTGPQHIEIQFDGQVLYKGLLGTVEYAPAIVIDRTLWLQKGSSHTLCVDVPLHSFSKCVPVTVGNDDVTMIVSVDQDKVVLEAHYGVILFE